MNVKETLKHSTIALAVLLCTQNAVAGDYHYQRGAVVDDYVNYTIGGGSVIHPMASNTQPERLNVGVAWNADLMCGNLDFNASVFNDLKGKAKNSITSLYNNIVAAAQGAVASMPALMLQRANPQLYDMLTNGAYQASLDFNNIKTSCEELGNKMADYGASGKWKKLGEANSLKELLAQGKEVVAKKFKESTEQVKQANKGTVWVGGEKKGGVGQQSINPNGDAVKAGYNTSQNRSATDKSSVAKNQCTGRACQVWKTPEEASTWTTDVIGDKTVNTCDNSQNGQKCGDKKAGTKVGKGLTPKIFKEIEEVNKNFDKVLQQDTVTDEELESISSSTVKVTRGLLEAIKESPNSALMTQKLSNEIGVSRALEKALLARRMLITGMREPNIANTEPAMEELEKSLTILDREIGQVKLELEMNQLLGTKTALTALQQAANDKLKNAVPNQAENTNKLQNLDKAPKEKTENLRRHNVK